MLLKIATLSCVLLAIVQSFPQRGYTPIPNYTKLNSQQIRHLQSNGFGPTVQSFRPTVAYDDVEDDDRYDDSTAESSQDRQPTYLNQNYPVPVRTTLPQQVSPKPQRPDVVLPAHYRRGEKPGEAGPSAGPRGNKLEEEEEKEEPDRLSILLPNSRFNCNGKMTGYYADEELGCEVFHYCQDNARHSWICPEGFTFHQVHLICMPPGGDNICEKSSDYHFVNEFLYKPLNLEEHQSKPNITLRYSDRYYPESYRPRYEEEDDSRPLQHQHSVRVTAQPRLQQIASSTFRPQTTIGQVFRNPEDINISLQQRRPAYVTARYTNNDDY